VAEKVLVLHIGHLGHMTQLSHDLWSHDSNVRDGWSCDMKYRMPGHVINDTLIGGGDLI